MALPAYTCFSVPASIVRAGLKLCPVDVDPETLDFDFSQLEALSTDNLLCILTSNLFGLVNDTRRLRRIAWNKGTFLVDDAAQALGACVDGHFAGTLGDVGFYSLARGKSLGAVEGGLIVTNSEEIAEAIQTELKSLPSPSFTHTAWLCLQMLGGSLFLHPRMYWIAKSLPFLKLGITEFDPNFPATSLSRLSQALLPQLLDRLLDLNEARRKNATAIVKAISGNPYFTVPKQAPDCQPIYTRFPVIAKDEATRHRALLCLYQAGIGASPFYPSAICDIGGIDRHMALVDFHRPQAEDLSRRLLTLPTHPFVCQRDLDRVFDILNGI